MALSVISRQFKSLTSLQHGINQVPSVITVARKASYHNKVEYRCKKIYQGPVKAVIFDWGGTVVDSGVMAPLMTFMELFKREGVDITEEEARGPMGAHKRVHIQKILENDSVLERWRKKHGSLPKDDDVDRMYQQFAPTILACIGQYSDVISGVPDTVKALRDQGIKVGSTTGYPWEVVEALLKSAAKQGFVPEANVAADQVPLARPCPYMVWACATKLVAHPIQSIIKVDDTVDGIGEGLSAGCWTVGVAKTSNYVGMTEKQLVEAETNGTLNKKLQRSYEILVNSGAHYVIDTVKEMPEVVRDINRRLASGESP